MKASDVMVRKAITTHPQASVSDVTKLLVDSDISALPLVDHAGRVVGVISEADLIRRVELDSENTRPWWLEAVTPARPRNSPGHMARELRTSCRTM